LAISLELDYLQALRDKTLYVRQLAGEGRDMARGAVVGILIVTLLAPASISLAAAPHVAPNAPKDAPEEARGKAEIDAFLAALKPAMDMAKKTYPEARERFLRGLPARHSFFVVTRLPVAPDGVEQVFVAVDRIDGDRIFGRIWSDILQAKSYKRGDRYSMSESQVIDWLITRPDGTEEGNYVGKAIDKIQADRLQRQRERQP
jgi:uncharacterized protein DUF2314